MCYGQVDLKALTRETESRLAGLPKVDVAAAPAVGLLARLRAALETYRGKEERHV
jgi:hypothetical protein